MFASNENDERRQHHRLSVSSGVIAVLITSCPEIIGTVGDVSLGGAKITYHSPKDLACEADNSKLKVDLISDNRFVEAIPCTNAWDKAVEADDFFGADDLRRCGIQFDGLTPNQLFLLRGFINRCAIKEEDTPAPEMSSASNQ